MAMQFYASPEQITRDRSEYARKGIARGRSVVVLTYEGGVLFVAENPSSAMHKVSEIYDRIGFAAVGRYHEFEAVRVAGIRLADLRGYSYNRRDVTGWALASAFSQNLGAIFMEQTKPFEVEICVAEVGATPGEDQLFRLTYDGSIGDEPQYVVMGGQADTISNTLKSTYKDGLDLKQALGVAVRALSTAGTSGNGSATPTLLDMDRLEVAVLDRDRPQRKFRRISGAALAALLKGTDGEPEAAKTAEPATDQAESGGGETGSEPHGQ